MGASDEPGAREDDVERYEELRHSALSGSPSGWRLGLALLEGRGLLAWARAWRATPPAPPSSPQRPALQTPGGAEEIVGALASMALACVGGR